MWSLVEIRVGGGRIQTVGDVSLWSADSFVAPPRLVRMVRASSTLKNDQGNENTRLAPEAGSDYSQVARVDRLLGEGVGSRRKNEVLRGVGADGSPLACAVRRNKGQRSATAEEARGRGPEVEADRRPTGH